MTSLWLVALLSLAASVASASSLNLADVPCGEIARKSRRFHARIMGGSVAHITDFPHAVSLRKNGEHFCGGALVRGI